jgi:hypothetical protein
MKIFLRNTAAMGKRLISHLEVAAFADSSINLLRFRMFVYIS